jgi:hypothetical protein
MPAPEGIHPTTWERFENFANAHHDGNQDDALSDLLFCHKVLYAHMMRKNRTEDDHK